MNQYQDLSDSLDFPEDSNRNLYWLFIYPPIDDRFFDDIPDAVDHHVGYLATEMCDFEDRLFSDISNRKNINNTLRDANPKLKKPQAKPKFNTAEIQVLPNQYIFWPTEI